MDLGKAVRFVRGRGDLSHSDAVALANASGGRMIGITHRKGYTLRGLNDDITEKTSRSRTEIYDSQGRLIERTIIYPRQS